MLGLFKKEPEIYCFSWKDEIAHIVMTWVIINLWKTLLWPHIHFITPITNNTQTYDLNQIIAGISKNRQPHATISFESMCYCVVISCATLQDTQVSLFS